MFSSLFSSRTFPLISPALESQLEASTSAYFELEHRYAKKCEAEGMLRGNIVQLEAQVHSLTLEKEQLHNLNDVLVKQKTEVAWD